MLLLLLLLHHVTPARKALHEYQFGRDYGYVEAYPEANKTGRGTDYNENDYKDEDSYEYKEDLDDDFRSGGIDSEVRPKSRYLIYSLSSRNASVARGILRVQMMQQGLSVARRAH